MSTARKNISGCCAIRNTSSATRLSIKYRRYMQFPKIFIKSYLSGQQEVERVELSIIESSKGDIVINPDDALK